MQTFLLKIKEHKVLLLSLIFFLSSSFTIRLIAAPFTAPATLDPACAPGAADCYVITSSFSTGLTSTSGVVTSNLSTGVSGGQSVVGGTASGNNLTLSSTSNATKGKIVFGTSAYDEVNNFLGVGTATPTNILSLGGTSARTIWMERNTTAATAGQGLTLSSGGAIAGTADLAGGDLNLKSGISTGRGSSALHFFTATSGSTGTTDNTPTEKMTILGSGNVGVGLTSPTALFQVTQPTTGPGTVSNDTSGNVTGFDTNFKSTFKIGDIITINGVSRAVATVDTDTAMTTASFLSSNSNLPYTLTGGNRFAVLGNGHVGIGTTTPGVALEITNDDNPGTIEKIHNTSSGGYSEIRLYNDTDADHLSVNFFGSAFNDNGVVHSVGNIATIGSFPLLLGTNNVERMRIAAGGNITMGTSTVGNVGIGSSTKLSRLTVTGLADIADGGGSTIADSDANALTIDTANALYITRGSIGVGDRIALSPSAPGTYATVIAIGSETRLTVDTALSTSAGESYLVKKSLFRLDDASNATKFMVNDLGYVGIGNTVPAQVLDVVGTIRQTGGLNCGLSSNASGDIICTSDANLKDNLKAFTGGLSVINGINPSYFQYIGESYVHAGFIAQNVQSVLPEATPLQNNGYLGLDTNAIIAASVNAIKELDIKIQNISGLTSSSGSGSVVDQLVGAIVNLKELIVEKLSIGSSSKPTAITVYDKNGNAGCMTVEDVNTGATKIIPGVCADIAPISSSASAPVEQTVTVVEPTPDVVAPEVIPESIVEPIADPIPAVDPIITP